jgi:ion transport protein
VLTQEDWNEVLYNGMEKTSAWAALYFIALMTFGNYVLFNLLVAILVEGFSTEVMIFFCLSSLVLYY